MDGQVRSEGGWTCREASNVPRMVPLYSAYARALVSCARALTFENFATGRTRNRQRA